MSINVLWEEMRWNDEAPHEPGISHVLATLRDEHSLVQRFLVNFCTADFPYLQFISHETVTVFHQQHIPQLVRELEALCEQEHEPDVEKHLHAILEFVRHAYGTKNTHIAFRAG
jgi:translation initiation factor IF-2